MNDPNAHRSRAPSPAGREDLRNQAEARVNALMQTEPNAPANVRRLLHELSVSHAELEMQNEELRRAQASLEEAKTRYLDLYIEAPVAYVTIGAEGLILDANRLASQLLGLDSARLARQRFSDFLAWGFVNGFEAARIALLTTGLTRTIELQMTDANGVDFWAELLMNIALGDDDHVQVCRIAITDVTERRQMQDDVARMAAIVRSSELAIISQKVDGTVTSWNGGAEQLFGYTAEEMMGGHLRILFPELHRADEPVLRNRVIKGETVARESVMVKRGGNLVPVSVTIFPVSEPDGKIAGVAQIARDISDQVAGKEQLSQVLSHLRASEQALRDADHRKDVFIATLAHELRNPLAPIRNAAAVLYHTPNLEPRVEWCRDVIDRQVGQMAALLEDLLDVSRITRNRIVLKRERVDLAIAIGHAVEITRPDIDAKSHTLVVDLPESPIEVEGDLTRLTQIFGNLLSNASKYSDPGGKIDVALSRNEGSAVVVVSDQGIGIDSTQLNRIFELFSQIDTVVDRSQGGLGIGLSLVRGLVEMHGGSIEAFSEGPGRGSQFVVTLPALAPARRSSGPARHREDPARVNLRPGAAIRVLVADDNDDAATSMATILRLYGFEVEVAHDGELAIALLDQFRPEAAVLDVGMPGLNGYETARRIRAITTHSRILLIACTGWGQTEDVRRSKEAGFDHHLVKPVDPGMLVELLAGVGTRGG